MSKREYPRQAWVLLPSFKPKELTITEHCRNWGEGMDWDYASTGKAYNVDKLYDSRSAAIAAGQAQVAKLQADIAKRQDTLNKRIAALDKAEAASNDTGALGDTGGAK